MWKNILLVIFFYLLGICSFAQLYDKPVYPKGYFRWPLSLKPDIVANMGELRPNHWHMGLDMRTNQVVNQNVYASADGYISFVGIEPFSWGRWIIINHPNGLSTLYGHLNDFRSDLEQYVKQHQYQNESWVTALTIPPGKFPVKKGDFISLSGTTGGSGGPHVHWEVIDTKSGKRLNPTLFGTPIADNVPPTVLKIAMYDRNNSVYNQSPSIFKVVKSIATHTVPGGVINTNLKNLSFSVQAYDTRNGSSNQDGIYSARLFFDGDEISSFYIDSIAYPDSRYMNCQVDYKMKALGGSWMQHLSKLPGDKSGVYYDLGINSIIRLNDLNEHDIKIEVADANGNQTSISFKIRNNGGVPPVPGVYEWFAGKPNKLFKPAFEAYLLNHTIYDKMNPNYSSFISNLPGSISLQHRLGEDFIPVHSNFEVRIKPNKSIAGEDKNRIVIKNTSKKSTVKKAEWNGEWVTAQFRDFGIFEAFVDNSPPEINSLGSGEVVNLNKASRIVFTPKDDFGIADFRAELDGEWLRFTNDKGRNYIYVFDDKISPGQHELKVMVTDIAGNITTKTWQFVKGVYAPPAKIINETKEVKSTKKPVASKKTETKKGKSSVKKPSSPTKPLSKNKSKETVKKTTAETKKASSKKKTSSKN